MSERMDCTVDPARSEVRFTSWSLWGLLPVSGRFAGPHGSLTVDEDAVVRGVLSVEAGSIDTGITMRDRHLRMEKFLDVDHHPVLTVEADGCRLVDGTITGNAVVKARGVTVRVPVTAVVRSVGSTTIVTCQVVFSISQLGVRIAIGFIRSDLVVEVYVALVPTRVEVGESPLAVRGARQPRRRAVPPTPALHAASERNRPWRSTRFPNEPRHH